MIASLIYAMVFAGVQRLTRSVWKAAIWPYYAGKVLGAVIAMHAQIKSERGRQGRR